MPGSRTFSVMKVNLNLKFENWQQRQQEMAKPKETRSTGLTFFRVSQFLLLALLNGFGNKKWGIWQRLVANFVAKYLVVFASLIEVFAIWQQRQQVFTTKKKDELRGSCFYW